MKISIRLVSFLCKYVHRDENRCSIEMEVSESSRCADLLYTLKIPKDIPVNIMVNGTVADGEYQLREGDQIVFLPPIEGG